MVTVESTAVGEPGAFAVRRLASTTRATRWSSRPPAARWSTTRSPTAPPLELAGAYAFGDRFEVSGALPFLSQGGDDPQFSGIAAAEGSALGDLRVRGKAFLVDLGRCAFGTSAEVTLPTATDSEFAGGQGPSAAARLLADYSTGSSTSAINAGALMRQKAQLADVEQGHQFIYGLAGAYRVTPRIAGIGELFGAIDIGGGPAGGKPLELVLGGRYRVNRDLGGGRRRRPRPPARHRLAGHAGVRRCRLRAARAAAGARTGERRLGRLDDDGDDVPASSDRCPDEAEDKDGFQDDDGCPDLRQRRRRRRRRDRPAARASPRTATATRTTTAAPRATTTRDGIADADDRCPDQPEDGDGFEDDDGCPDPDNDGDGFADAAGQVPGRARDHQRQRGRRRLPRRRRAAGVRDQGPRRAVRADQVQGRRAPS